LAFGRSAILNVAKINGKNGGGVYPGKKIPDKKKSNLGPFCNADTATHWKREKKKGGRRKRYAKGREFLESPSLTEGRGSPQGGKDPMTS